MVNTKTASKGTEGEQINSIDTAIKHLEERISHYRTLGYLYLSFSLITLVVTVLFMDNMVNLLNSDVIKVEPYLLEEPAPMTSAQQTRFIARIDESAQALVTAASQAKGYRQIVMGAIMLAAMTVFGVFIALYRSSLIQTEKLDHQLLGFLRTRIAANNYGKAGFESEVRISLTQGAFDPPHHKQGKIESPLPGHPGVDLTASMVNRLMDILEKQTKSNSG